MNNDYLFICASQSIIIIGWFWLIMFTIFRAENFKKRYFTILILIYLIQGIVKISELVLIEKNPDVISPLSVFSNALCIFGFTFLTLRYIKFKVYFDEKTNNVKRDSNNDNSRLRRTESP